MPNTLPENWFEITPICYEYRFFPYDKDKDGKPKPGTAYLTVVKVEKRENSIEVSIDSFSGGYADGAAALSTEIPLEIINRLVSGEKK
jgi:hypothetical protein